MKKITLLLFLLIAGLSGTMGQEAAPRAKFLYQMTRYASWNTKSTTETSLVITVVGQEDVANELRKIVKGKTVMGLPVKVASVSKVTSLPTSDVVYVAQEFAKDIPDIIKDQRNRQILIIGGDRGMCASGASMSMVPQSGNKFGFEWSKANMASGKVQISPKVLAYGSEVN